MEKKQSQLKKKDVTKTGNGERESGKECTAVFRITIQNVGRRKRTTWRVSVFVIEGLTSEC